MAALATVSSSLATASCSVSRPSAVAASSTTGLRVAPLPLGAGIGTSSLAAKTVSNGSRTNAFLVVNPNTNLKFETLSYLPPLTDDQIYKQLSFLIRKNLIPAVEFDTVSSVSKTNYAGPGYYDGRYYTLWKLPLFGANDAGQVLREVQEARKAYPNSFIRVIGFDNVRQVQVVAFLVQKPAGFQS